MIEAITFDFWDTIAIDDSDEPKRAALGLLSKAEAREQLFVLRVTAQHPEILPQDAVAAYAFGNEKFRHSWKEEHRTPGVAFRIYEAYKHLGLAPDAGGYGRFVGEIQALTREIEDMEVRIPPDFAPGVHAVLAELAADYPLAIISDTIHTTGQGLRHLLASQGLMQHFRYFFFSDELRASKPAVSVFRRAALEMGQSPPNIVHVGDRESNDVAGPRSIGMRAILYTGIVDRGSASSRAHAVCRHLNQLPFLIRRLA